MKSWNRALWAVIVLVTAVGCGSIYEGEDEAREVVEEGEPLITEMVADLPGFTVTTQLRAPSGCKFNSCTEEDTVVWYGVARARHEATDTEAEALAIREQLETAAQQAGYTYACTATNESGATYWTHPDLPGKALIYVRANEVRFGHNTIPLTAVTCEP